MKSFITRAISAIIALGVLFSLFHFWSANGIKVLIVLAVVIGGLEAIKILFPEKHVRSLNVLFYAANLAMFTLMVLFPAYSQLMAGFGSVIFFAVSLFFHNQFTSISQLRDFLSRAALGFFYVGTLPFFAWQVLSLSQGVWWFFYLLSVVFAGDVGAYLFGVLWGKHKIMPKLSPKKSYQGSLGGLVGSTLAAIVCSRFNDLHATGPLVLLAIVAGLTAQLGDFFESLLKRVADVKDSGSIMPGHGGILDRIDGVLFASPVVLLGALILEKLI